MNHYTSRATGTRQGRRIGRVIAWALAGATLGALAGLGYGALHGLLFGLFHGGLARVGLHGLYFAAGGAVAGGLVGAFTCFLGGEPTPPDRLAKDLGATRGPAAGFDGQAPAALPAALLRRSQLGEGLIPRQHPLTPALEPNSSTRPLKVSAPVR